MDWANTTVATAALALALLELGLRLRAERQLKAIRRMGEPPLYAPSAQRFSQLYEDAGPGRALAHRAGAPYLLCFMRDEVDPSATAGQEVLLVIDQIGPAPKAVSAELDGKRLRIFSEPQLDGSSGLTALAYEYSPQKRGQAQQIRFQVEPMTGGHHRHTYRTIHGKRFLERIDPPLP